jgi:site-specific DNA-methyltransferase (adenine-specific)
MKTTTIKNQADWRRLRPMGYRRPSIVGLGEPVPFVELPRKQILLGDAAERLQEVPNDSIDCVVTSPPYYALRDYGVPGQIGLEANVDGWVSSMRNVLYEVARVLKPGGSLWLNLGDSFSRHPKYGAPPKGLLAAPERLLLALMDDGWIVRGKVIWNKPNGMPNSVADRPNLNYEVVYFLVRSPHYFFDLDAIREPHRSRKSARSAVPAGPIPAHAGPLASGNQSGLRRARAEGQPGHPLGKNPGSVWTIPTRGFRGPHFATFPPALVRRPILASCPEAICCRCGVPWKRTVTVERMPVSPAPSTPRPRDPLVMRFKESWHNVRTVGDLVPCACDAPALPGVVLDPFMGSGTVGIVANELGRHWIGVELSADYRNLALERIENARRGG